jgi:hypothetical protein
MRQPFPLFQSHLDLAHAYWQRLVQPGDCVIDATCGNGWDTLALAQCALGPDKGVVYALDLQPEAVAATHSRLQAALDSGRFARVHVLQQSHDHFPAEISQGSVRLIVYNLGYLPGGDKALTTCLETTLASLEQALPLLCSGGCLSLTTYPGHAAGEKEHHALLAFASALDPAVWSCCHHRWLNRNAAPTLLLIQRQGTPVQPTTRL